MLIILYRYDSVMFIFHLLKYVAIYVEPVAWATCGYTGEGSSAYTQRKPCSVRECYNMHYSISASFQQAT